MPSNHNRLDDFLMRATPFQTIVVVLIVALVLMFSLGQFASCSTTSYKNCLDVQVKTSIDLHCINAL